MSVMMRSRALARASGDRKRKFLYPSDGRTGLAGVYWLVIKSPAEFLWQSGAPAFSRHTNAFDSSTVELIAQQGILWHALLLLLRVKGVGKTTSSAAIATGLAQKGKKRNCRRDFDIGLRNLDLIMGCERRVVYDFVKRHSGAMRH